MISIDGSILIVKEHPNKGLRMQLANCLRARPKKLLTHWNVDLFGGADRARTGDLLVANQVLSQLSYSPFTRLIRRKAGAPRSAPRTLSAASIVIHLRKHGGSGKI